MTDGQREEMGLCGFMWRTCLFTACIMSGAYALEIIINYGPANDGFGTYEELSNG